MVARGQAGTEAIFAVGVVITIFAVATIAAAQYANQASGLDQDSDASAQANRLSSLVTLVAASRGFHAVVEIPARLGDGTLVDYVIYPSAVALNYTAAHGSTLAVSSHGALNVSTNSSEPLPLALAPGVYELNESYGQVIFSRIG